MVVKFEYLNLPLENGRQFYLCKDYINKKSEELEDFLSLENNMHDLHFAKKMMFSHELQANNQVEGYGDDLAFIENVIKRKTDVIKDQASKKRILNLYRGYQYIIAHKKVDKIHLKELYQILSSGLLEKSDSLRMGEFYRNDTVYILKNGRLDMSLDEGVDVDNIKKLMDKYFEFFNNNLFNSNTTDEYIKSQILHFYFVYVHPYFDVNGRTSRTMAMWHLLNKKAYPYIIFNRGISFRGSEYDKMIRNAKDRHDLTQFIDYMLDTVKVELEKEYIMQSITSDCKHKLDSGNYQTILYFLTLNGLKTIGDFTRFYNNLNDKKKPKEVYNEMLLPLIDYDILKVDRYTKKCVFDDVPNMVLSLNSSNFEIDPAKIKRLKLK